MAGKEGLVNRVVEFSKNVDIVAIPTLAFLLYATPLGPMYPAVLSGLLAGSIASYIGGSLIQSSMEKKGR